MVEGFLPQTTGHQVGRGLAWASSQGVWYYQQSEFWLDDLGGRGYDSSARGMQGNVFVGGISDAALPRRRRLRRGGRFARFCWRHGGRVFVGGVTSSSNAGNHRMDVFMDGEDGKRYAVCAFVLTQSEINTVFPGLPSS